MASSNSLLLDNVDDPFGPPTSMVVSSLATPANASTMRAENPIGESDTPEVSEDENPLSYASSEQKQQLRFEIKRGLTKIERYYGQSLRGKQRQVLRNLYKGQSVVLRAPTGWGKSRIFQGFRLMLQKDKDSMDPRKDPITIIVTPLLGLGDAQVLELNHKEPDTAIFLNGSSSSNDLLRVSKGYYRVIYISPETSQTPEVGRALWWNPNFRHLVCLVAVDEAHLVDEWGRDFRKCYGQLGNIRDAMGPTIPWFVTSATMPTAQRTSIMESLHITDAVEIDENLNRPELYYNIIQSHIGDKFRGGMSTPLDHIVEELDLRTKKPVKKTLIYFDSIATLGCMLFHLRRLLVVAGYPADSVKYVVQGYFSDRTPGAKSRVYRAFLDGRAMVVCATEAFGMGMDIPDIDWVYNWGIPRSMSSLIQRFGRGARGKCRTAVCTLILPQYCKDIVCPPHPELIDVHESQSRELGDIIDSQSTGQTQSQAPLTKSKKNEKDPRPKGEHANLLALKRRSPDLYNFLKHYCLRKAIMEYLNGVDAEYTAFTTGQCCSLCSQARYHNNHNQHDPDSIGPRGYSGLAQTIPIQKKNKKARNTRPFIRAVITESLKEWRAEVLDLLWKAKDPLAIEEMIVSDRIIESIAKQAWMLAGDDQLPISSLCSWATFERFCNYIPDKPVVSVIVSSFRMGSEMWKDTQSKKKEQTRLLKERNRLNSARLKAAPPQPEHRGRKSQRGNTGPTRSSSQTNRTIGERDSSQESVVSEVGIVEEEGEQLGDENEAIDRAVDV